MSSHLALEHFTLEMKCLLDGGWQSPPASISRQVFAGKSLQSNPTFQS
jgi:hypothetical protein